LSAFTPPPLPSDDKRWKIVNGTMRKNGFARHALIETLHTVQSSFGYLDDDAIRFVAGSLRVPLSQAYGVATFYHYFSLKPPASTRSPSAPGRPATSRAPTSWWPRLKSGWDCAGADLARHTDQPDDGALRGRMQPRSGHAVR